MKVQVHRDGFQGFLEGQGDIVAIASTVTALLRRSISTQVFNSHLRYLSSTRKFKVKSRSHSLLNDDEILLIKLKFK
jgi:hypothetical protein